MGEFKPGCFGSPLAYAGNKLCAACPFYASCGSAAEVRSKHLKARYGIEAAIRTTARRQPKLDAQVVMGPVPSAVSRLPAKAQEILASWRARGVDLRRAIATRTNPFENGAGFMRIAIRDLLAGGLSKVELRKAYVEELSLPETAALGHALFAISVLLATGAARQDGDTVVPFNKEMGA